MIGFLKGRVLIFNQTLIIDVHGVGYQVIVSPSLLAQLVPTAEVSLQIHTHVKEDALELYGFRLAEEKQLFLLLLNVSGVGPRTALAITQKEPQAIIDAVQQANSRFFSQIPRIGKKLAQKIIIDLKSKLGSLKELDLGPVSAKEQDIVTALISLGFNEQDVLETLHQTDLSELPLETAIKQVIQKMSKV
ncbi:MAG: Holliday junction branch migration protein RuvA [Candidatus Pacebacteria bacterium CG_4_10_14_0_8_um_filter_43_12]|nr:MAG: Holliday junction branch migration protein RuvA [Candidatus Pacebacteria bacterium CG10_big_fil_rev_8_21_14_0_10_44_11]PIY79939.1 MAG: Holliday junction branch migration protein RuvA [Candidatus Pacebacteria bacterium CG_4_10_14_0_8_um_filter_43_12]